MGFEVKGAFRLLNLVLNFIHRSGVLDPFLPSFHRRLVFDFPTHSGRESWLVVCVHVQHRR